MNTNPLSLSVLSIALFAILPAACASSSTNDASLGATTSSAMAAQAASVPNLSGTWSFVLDASEVGTALRQECATRSAGDTTKAAACWNEVANETALEKIRFTTDAAGHTTWTSLRSEGSNETVFLEVPVELAADGPNRILAKVVGAYKGTQAAHVRKSSGHVMPIEVIDARTIAMNDAKKGRLVFAKE